MTFACLAPLEKSAPIRFEMPAGATDAHSHVIGVPPDYPFVTERSYTPPEAPLSAYLDVHRRLGIERAVIVTPSCHGTNNCITLEAIAGYGAQAQGQGKGQAPGQALGIAVVDADVSSAELAALHAGGIRGVRLNVLFGGGIGLQALPVLAEKIRPLGWHMQLLINVSESLAVIADTIRTLDIPFVIDHMGHMPARHALDDPGFKLLLSLAAEGHVWVKLSGCDRVSDAFPHYREATKMARALIDANASQMLWGTDWPHVAKAKDMPDDGELLNRLVDYAPDETVRRAILVDNPARLYGF
ncbi:MAG: amidohydrolase family protein [Pseudomonadota bacterium]